MKQGILFVAVEIGPVVVTWIAHEKDYRTYIPPAELVWQTTINNDAIMFLAYKVLLVIVYKISLSFIQLISAMYMYTCTGPLSI